MMKKLLLAFLVLGISATQVKAQLLAGHLVSTSSWIAEIMGTIEAAQSTTANYHLSAGAGVQGELPVSKAVKVTASAGYQNYQYKVDLGPQYGVVKSHSGYIPLLAGAKFKLSSKLYAHGQLGYSISTEKGGSGAFTYAPSIGTRFGKFDASLKYMALTDGGGSLGSVGFKLGYVL